MIQPNTHPMEAGLMDNSQPIDVAAGAMQPINPQRMQLAKLLSMAARQKV
jgi:hypothetical protein